MQAAISSDPPSWFEAESSDTPPSCFMPPKPELEPQSEPWLVRWPFVAGSAVATGGSNDSNCARCEPTYWWAAMKAGGLAAWTE